MVNHHCVRLRSVRSGLIAIALMLVWTVDLVTPSRPAGAYNLEGCKQYDADVLWHLHAGTPSTYANAADWSTYFWDNSATNLSFTEQSPGNDLGIGISTSPGSGYDGITYYSCVGGSLSPAYSYWNTSYTDSYSIVAKEQVMIHEIGHALGLDHAGTSTCSGQPIMYYSSDRYFVCGHALPETDDVNGINHLYP